MTSLVQLWRALPSKLNAISKYQFVQLALTCLMQLFKDTFFCKKKCINNMYLRKCILYHFLIDFYLEENSQKRNCWILLCKYQSEIRKPFMYFADASNLGIDLLEFNFYKISMSRICCFFEIVSISLFSSLLSFTSVHVQYHEQLYNLGQLYN